MNTDEQAVASVLKTYERALNASDTAAVMKLYAPDGVFMAQNSPSSVGADAIRRAYDAVFAAIRLTVEFQIAEVRQFDVNQIGQCLDGELGDAEGTLVAFQAGPFVRRCITKRFRIHRVLQVGEW